MLSVVKFSSNEKVLDLGCGYGVIGIWAAKMIGPENVVMLDIDPEAVEISKENARLNDVEGVRIYESDGLRNMFETDFSTIICNPPYHTDFAVAKHFVHKGFNRLRLDGRMYMAAKRELWYKNKLKGIFGNVKIWHLAGYSVFMSIKRSDTYAKVLQKERKNTKS
jgi:16S rRNA (guanine1207-N2)-methyltransferase